MADRRLQDLLEQASTPGPGQQGAIVALLQLTQGGGGVGGAPPPIPQQVSQANLIQPNDTLPLIIGPSLDEDTLGTRRMRQSAQDYLYSARNQALGQQQNNLDMQRMAKERMGFDTVRMLDDNRFRRESQARAAALADIE